MLTPEQIVARTNRLTASRIACLMVGDAPKVLALYLEMIGEGEPEDLSRYWPARLGAHTEQLNLDWYELKGGNKVTRRGEVVLHPVHRDWAACTLDGWDADIGCPIETKHCGGREPLEVLIDRYQPQCQWQMECTGATVCALSVILGADEPRIEYLDRDAGYAAEMVRRGQQFIRCVRDRVPPVELPAMPAPIDASKIYDMSASNVWGNAAAQWLTTRQAAQANKDSEKILKATMPADAKKAFGHAVQITRDRAGRLSLREHVA